MKTLLLFSQALGLGAISMFFVLLLYATTVTLINNIIRDWTKIKQYNDIKKENKELLEKIQKLEIELVDKKLAEEYNKNKRTKIEF